MSIGSPITETDTEMETMKRVCKMDMEVDAEAETWARSRSFNQERLHSVTWYERFINKF